MILSKKKSFLIFLFCFVSLFISAYLGFSPPRRTYHIQYPSYFGRPAQPMNDTLKTTIIELGRHLFYDKRLSGNNKISCASCHIQKFAFSDSSRFSSGATGKTTRNSMSLTNLIWQDKYFWEGRTRTLEEQALIPIQNVIEMNQSLDLLVKELACEKLYRKLFKNAFGNTEITSSKIAIAIAQFEKRIISSQSRYDRFLSGDTFVFSPQEKRGLLLFTSSPDPRNKIRGAGCAICHKGNLLFSLEYENNGLDIQYADGGLQQITHNPLDHGKFKVPSLRNIALTAPYMHDGRFKNLKEVINHYNEHIQHSSTLSPFMISSNSMNGKLLGLTSGEVDDLITFLNTLTDKHVIQKKEYSNPF